MQPARLARLTLMRVVSDFREAMWGVLQQGVSTLDVDFVAYAPAASSGCCEMPPTPGSSARSAKSRRADPAERDVG